MKPDSVKRNEITGIPENVVFTYNDYVEITFVPNRNGVKVSLTNFLKPGLMDSDKNKIAKEAEKKYQNQAWEILQDSKYNAKKELLITHNLQLKKLSHNGVELGWLNDFIEREIFLSDEGGITILQREKRSKSQKVIPCQYKDLLSAIRAQSHIIETYNGNAKKIIGEINNILELENLITEFNSFIIESNSQENYSKEILEQKSNKIQEELKKCRNHLKKSSRKKISKSANEKDTLNRKNLGSKAALTMSALKDLEKRILEISRIIPNIAARKNFLNRFRTYNNRRFYDVLGGLRHIEQKDFHKDKKDIDLTLGIALHNLSWRLVEPYKSIADIMYYEIQHLKEALREGNKELFISILQGNIAHLLKLRSEKQEI